MKVNMNFMRVISLILALCSVLSMSMYTICAFDFESSIDPNQTVTDSLDEELDVTMIPDAIGIDLAHERSHIRRLYEAEGDSLDTIFFENTDGTVTQYIFDYPVKYVTDDGVIEDVKLSISKDDAAGAYKSTDNNIHTYFPKVLSEGITLTDSDVSIKLTPSIQSTPFSSVAYASTAKLKNSKTVSYPYGKNTNIEYTLTYTGYKEDIVVNEYTGQTDYKFVLETNGLSLECVDESYYLVDDSSCIKATIGDIIIFTADEKNNTFGSLTAETVVEKQEYIITIHVDPNFLSDKATMYPIRIDPSIEINSSSGSIEDVTINSLTGSSGTSGSLSVGKRKTYGISRILMKFPSLSLSSIVSEDKIMSAHVEIRDLMCESEAMTVHCYPFTGNTWSESTANWSNVSPNSYSASTVSSNAISYANGKGLSSPHRYSFDITKIVKGWKSGNFTQSKGIIFKASSSVENGSTYIYKTIASFNRSSNKPSLSITYNIGGTQTFSSGTYYINNKSTGKYIRYYSSSVFGESGLISSLGKSIRWEIVKVDGGYVIRSISDKTKYLGVTSSSSSSSVSVVNVSNTTIPTKCKWTEQVVRNSDKTYRLKNNYNSGYLYMNGTSLATDSSIGTFGTANYDSHIWRLVTNTYYGTGSSVTKRELGSNFSVGKVIVNIGSNIIPTITKSPSNAIWADASDFTYTRVSGTSGCISINSRTGIIIGAKPGIAKYKATHKVTNRTYTFTVYVDRFTYVLQNEFGFDNDNDALLIRNFYERVHEVYPNDSSVVHAWKCSQLLGMTVYGQGGNFLKAAGKNIAFGDVVGRVFPITTKEVTFFTVTLKYTAEEYAHLKSLLINQHGKKGITSDFAHMQISLAARLAYKLEKDKYLSNIATVEDDVTISYLAGWLGDATLTEGSSTTSFGNDDYHADLDAENIYNIILSGSTIMQASNNYYDSLSSSHNRAHVFLSHISYSDIETSVCCNLVQNWVIEEMKKTNNKEELIKLAAIFNSREKQLEFIKLNHHDTYNFFHTIKNNLPDIKDYYS